MCRRVASKTPQDGTDPGVKPGLSRVPGSLSEPRALNICLVGETEPVDVDLACFYMCHRSGIEKPHRIRPYKGYSTGKVATGLAPAALSG